MPLRAVDRAPPDGRQSPYNHLLPDGSLDHLGLTTVGWTAIVAPNTPRHAFDNHYSGFWGDNHRRVLSKSSFRVAFATA